MRITSRSAVSREAQSESAATPRRGSLLYKGLYLVTPVLAIAVIVGCCFLCNKCKREVDIVPGLKWKYYSDHYSSLTWEKYGKIAEGDFHFGIWRDGVCVYGLGVNKSIYIDLLERRIATGSDAGVKLGKDISIMFASDAQTAMGIYNDYGKNVFEKALHDLRGRLANARKVGL